MAQKESAYGFTSKDVTVGLGLATAAVNATAKFRAELTRLATRKTFDYLRYRKAVLDESGLERGTDARRALEKMISKTWGEVNGGGSGADRDPVLELFNARMTVLRLEDELTLTAAQADQLEAMVHMALELK